MCARLCVCVLACVRACVRVCLSACIHVSILTIEIIQFVQKVLMVDSWNLTINTLDTFFFFFEKLLVGHGQVKRIFFYLTSSIFSFLYIDRNIRKSVF